MYQVLMRGWMAFSGVLLVADYMPSFMRSAAAWIPMTHAVTLYRSGQYPNYPTLILDLRFLFISTITVVAGSWLLENGTRRWRSFR